MRIQTITQLGKQTEPRCNASRTYKCVKGGRIDDEDEPWTPLELRLLARLKDLLRASGPPPTELVERVLAAAHKSLPRPHLRLLSPEKVTLPSLAREQALLLDARPKNDG